MDGTRTLISIVQTCQHEVWYATDRRNETYILSRRHLKDSPLEKFDVVLCAVLDAELVLNDLIEPAAEPSVPSEATDSTPQRSFDLFCFDLLRWAGRDYAHKPFWIRHRLLGEQFPKHDVVSPRERGEDYRIHVCVRNCADLRQCSVWTKVAARETSELAMALQPELVPQCDGIVLYHRNCSYFEKGTIACYRWKPPHVLTIDLLIRKHDSEQQRHSLFAWEGKGIYKPVTMKQRVQGVPEWEGSERIAEFVVNKDMVTFVRWRDDKYCANHSQQVLRTIRQQQQPLTWSLLVEATR